MKLEFPGLFDLQVNGFAGVDFNAPDLTSDGLAEALERQRATGVTRCLPTLITSSLDRFARNARVIARSPDPAVAGIHMEGPYLSPEDGPRGAHPREHVTDASIADFDRRQEAADGRIVLVTLAPEAPGALSLIDHLVKAGVRVAIGHTGGTPQQVEDAISAGATLATHLGNGCAQMLPRHPNFIWTLLAADPVAASFIVDGHHLPAATVKAMVRAKGVERSILVTDATSAAGCGPGRYSIGDVVCESREDGRVSLPGTPYLAGILTHPGSSHRQHREVHGPADRHGPPHGLDDPRALSRSPDSRHGQRRVGRVRVERAERSVRVDLPPGQTPGVATSIAKTWPVRARATSSTFSIPRHSVAITNNVFRLTPPRAHEKQPRSSGDRLQHLAALPDPYAPLVGHVRVPDGLFRIEANAVGNTVTQVGPHAAVGKAAVCGDVEGRQFPAMGLGHDERGVVRRHRHTVRKGAAIGNLPRRAVRRYERDRIRRVDVRVAAAVHDDLIPGAARKARQVRVVRQRAGWLPS